MNLDEAVQSAVKTAVTEVLKNKYTRPYPAFASKKTMASILNISPRQLNRLTELEILQAEVHYTRFVDNGYMMFAVKKVIETLKPALTELDEIL